MDPNIGGDVITELFRLDDSIDSACTGIGYALLATAPLIAGLAMVAMIYNLPRFKDKAGYVYHTTEVMFGLSIVLDICLPIWLDPSNQIVSMSYGKIR